MFECKYKFQLEDSIISAKYVYKSQKRKQDKIIAFLIPILLIAMIGMLIWDIIKNNSFVWDIVLIGALAVLEAMYLLIPILLVRSQKKAYKKQNLHEMDYILIKIDANTCSEALFKDDKQVSSSNHSLKFLTSYLEDNDRLILVFNKIEYVCLRKSAVTGDVKQLKEHLQKVMFKNSKNK